MVKNNIKLFLLIIMFSVSSAEACINTNFYNNYDYYFYILLSFMIILSTFVLIIKLNQTKVNKVPFNKIYQAAVSTSIATFLGVTIVMMDGLSVYLLLPIMVCVVIIYQMKQEVKAIC